MGIPSYFSYIVKNYPDIIKKFETNKMNVDNLYLDCNSIVYEVYYKLEATDDIVEKIITDVIAKIVSYIDLINPRRTVIIAFDGVAPVAKLEQQRSRRYKSWYQNELSKTIYNKTQLDPWNTTAITPGTEFMSKLGGSLTEYFNRISKPEGPNIIVSASNVVGEGEHKLFEYIRSEPDKHKSETTVIYGLDADLIMLSINHLPVCPNIYLFRETPQFIKSINSSLEPESNYYLDIPELTKSILAYMNNENINVVYDYIFLSFFLGNDFLPHFPALNIRTGGIDKLLGAYRVIIGGQGLYLTKNGKSINWNNVRKFVSYLASSEEAFIIKEHRSRNNKEKHEMPENTPEEMMKKFDSTPLYSREMEHFINPVKPYWQSRYYRGLLNIKKETIEQCKMRLCINYLEGLEWTLKYYTSGCPDWRWCYKYNYPPLLVDLLTCIPVFETTFVPTKLPNPVSEIVQLCYVLPRSALTLLPQKFREALLVQHDNWYKNDYEFLWAYCRYFWESHVLMNEIDIDELEQFVSEHRHLLC